MIPRPILFLLGGIALVVMVGLGSLVALQRHAAAPQHTAGGPFTLTEMTGRPVTRKDFLGKPAAFFFGFTHCPDVCPTTLATLTDAMTRMGRVADRLNVVFVTVDPARDTAEQMRLYLSSFDPRIRGLTGTEAQVAAMASAYHVFFRRVPIEGGYTMDHSANVLLFDAAGRLAGAVNPSDAPDLVVAKLTTLAQPPACIPNGPPRVDLWSGAKLGSLCAT